MCSLVKFGTFLGLCFLRYVLFYFWKKYLRLDYDNFSIRNVYIIYYVLGIVVSVLCILINLIFIEIVIGSFINFLILSIRKLMD